MIKLLSIAIAAIALSGCAVYPANPYYGNAYIQPSVGVYVRPAPNYYGRRPGFYAPRHCSPYGCR